MYCTLGFSAITLYIFSSAKPPLTSLTYSTPNLIASLAILDLVVSIERATSFFTNSLITGITRFLSSSSVIRSAPGFVDSPPISIMSTPSAIISSARFKASSIRKCMPPSAKESGVMFKIPITKVLIIYQ